MWYQEINLRPKSAKKILINTKKMEMDCFYGLDALVL